MELEKIRRVEELTSVSELNQYLELGWVTVLSFVVAHNTEEPGRVSLSPRYHVAWTQDGQPQYPQSQNAGDWF